MNTSHWLATKSWFNLADSIPTNWICSSESKFSKSLGSTDLQKFSLEQLNFKVKHDVSNIHWSTAILGWNKADRKRDFKDTNWCKQRTVSASCDSLEKVGWSKLSLSDLYPKRFLASEEQLRGHRLYMTFYSVMENVKDNEICRQNE